jgi:hypothetical protein
VVIKFTGSSAHWSGWGFPARPDSSPENSGSDTFESDSDSDDSSVVEEFNPVKLREMLHSIGDEDDEGGGSGARPVTVHEVLNEEVAIPNVTEVDPDETLERVGEVLSVLQDKIVIVKGLASQIAGRAPERVLDTDTLLVFEDRKVLGYVSLFSHLFTASSLIVLAPSLRYRFTRPSGRHTNHYIKSGSTISFHWTRSGRKSHVQSFTFQIGATSCLLKGSNWRRVAMQVMCMTRSLVRRR